MKKILLFIISFLVLSPVKADVTTCDNYLLSSDANWQQIGSRYYPTSNNQPLSINLPGGSSYYIKFIYSTDPSYVPTFDGGTNLHTLRDQEQWSSVYTCNYYSDYNGVWRCIPGASLSTWRIGSTAPGFLNTTPHSPIVISTNIDDILNCALAPSEPDPPTPSPNIFTSFISLYTNRLGFLGSNFISNDILFTFIVIIFAFIILDFVISLLKGGKRK